MPNKLSFEEVKNNFNEKGFILLDKIYINNSTKLTFKDLNGYYYYQNYRNFSTRKPSRFGNNNPYTIQNIKLWCKLNNKPFELLSIEFENSNKKLKWKCLKENCGEIFNATWGSISFGEGCGYCRGLQVGLSNCLATRNPELAKQWHPTLNGDLNPYDVTCGCRKNVWWQCEKGHEWLSDVANRTNGQGCPYCTHNPRASKEYNLLIINPELCEEWDYVKNEKCPEEYTPGSNQKVWWICKECGHKWETQINFRNRGRGCPECCISKGEKRTKKWLEENNIFFVSQKEFCGLLGIKGKNLSYDFYLPNYNLLIEYQGEFHDGNTRKQTKKDIQRQQEHDRRKREYAQNHNIKLLEIWYYDFDNIEKILEKYLSMQKEAS